MCGDCGPGSSWPPSLTLQREAPSGPLPRDMGTEHELGGLVGGRSPALFSPCLPEPPRISVPDSRISGLSGQLKPHPWFAQLRIWLFFRVFCLHRAKTFSPQWSGECPLLIHEGRFHSIVHSLTLSFIHCSKRGTEYLLLPVTPLGIKNMQKTRADQGPTHPAYPQQG